MKAKCAHCGDEMKQDASGNLAFYCSKKECADIFMSNVLKNLTRKKEIK